MAHQRGHRAPGDLEVGATDVFVRHPTPHVAPRADMPLWLMKWERRRPRWAMELVAEFIGVFLYSWAGMGATCSFFTTSAEKVAGFGQLLNIAAAYGLAIALAVLIVGPTSGSHLSPGFTIAFATLKGFPWRKVPQYIIAQLLGGFVAGLVVYWQYKQPLVAITAEFEAEGPLGLAAIFTAQGPGGAIALFPTPGQSAGYLFLNEFMASLLVAITVFSVLDSSNIFVAPFTAPLLIGAIFFTAIIAFAAQTVVLNTARDLGGRFAVAAIWGSGAFTQNKAYTAVAALTNILTALLGGLIQILFLSDSNRPQIHAPPATAKPTGDDGTGPSTLNFEKSNSGQHYENSGHDQTRI